ncbi:MAG: hypothetical protein HYW91_02035 [Candidatus Sungbacteria bacterium]|nr:hypothetical protein [Candidatus Sungbacteria bacterium]
MAWYDLFRRESPNLRAVIDVGSHSIKTVVFSAGGARLPVGQGSVFGGEMSGNIAVPKPKIIKKTAFKFSSAPDPARVVTQLREILFSTLKELGRVPSVITIALGAYLADTSLATWTVGGNLPKKNSVSRRELGIYFQNLFEQKHDSGRALVAYPLGVLMNEYRIIPRSAQEKIPVKGAVGFQTMLLYFQGEIGTALASAKQSLGGLPIEFMPLAATYQESIPKGLGIADAFLIDIGGEETALALLKDGAIAQVASFPFGAHHFVRGTAKTLSISFDEADDLKRQYAAGGVGVVKKSELGLFLKEEAEHWKKMFLSSLDSFYATGPLPARVLLFGGGAYLAEIADAVRKPDWIGGFSYVSSPEVQILRAENFFGGETLGGFLTGPEDAGLASLIVYSRDHAPLFG